MKDSVQNKKWSGIQEDKIAWTKPITYNRWKKQSTRLLGIDFKITTLTKSKETKIKKFSRESIGDSWNEKCNDSNQLNGFNSKLDTTEQKN